MGKKGMAKKGKTCTPNHKPSLNSAKIKYLSPLEDRLLEQPIQ